MQLRMGHKILSPLFLFLWSELWLCCYPGMVSFYLYLSCFGFTDAMESVHPCLSPNWGKCQAIISSTIFFSPFSLSSPLGTSPTRLLDVLTQFPEALFTFFQSFFFSSLFFRLNRFYRYIFKYTISSSIVCTLL